MAHPAGKAPLEGLRIRAPENMCSENTWRLAVTGLDPLREVIGCIAPSKYGSHGSALGKKGYLLLNSFISKGQEEIKGRSYLISAVRRGWDRQVRSQVTAISQLWVSHVPQPPMTEPPKLCSLEQFSNKSR